MCENPDLTLSINWEKEMPGIKWEQEKLSLMTFTCGNLYAYNFNTPVEVAEFQRSHSHSGKCDNGSGWMYETRHVINGKFKRVLSANLSVVA
jgi:hypothetical protein